MINKEDFNRAYDLWNSFKEELMYKNRFIINHEVLDYIKVLCHRCSIIINEETKLYRARIYNKEPYYLKYLNSEFNRDPVANENQLQLLVTKNEVEDRKKTNFWGYDKNESFVPPLSDNLSGTSSNPAFVKYLYTSEDTYTAMVEVRPFLKNKISIAEILVKEQIKIIDFSYTIFEKSDNFQKLEGFEKYLIFFIMEDFSQPSNLDSKKYIPTQYVSEFIKSLGYDGIKFNSSLYARGKNITIFNYEKCEPISSDIYEIEDICFESKALAPTSQGNIVHWKLEGYKMNQLKNYIKMFKSNKG